MITVYELKLTCLLKILRGKKRAYWGQTRRTKNIKSRLRRDMSLKRAAIFTNSAFLSLRESHCTPKAQVAITSSVKRPNSSFISSSMHSSPLLYLLPDEDKTVIKDNVPKCMILERNNMVYISAQFEKSSSYVTYEVTKSN
jgi:hypothetical protein